MKNKYKMRIFKYVLTIMVMLAFVSIPAVAPTSNPTIVSISPNSKNVGDGQFTLTVTGTNYDSSSVVRFGSADLATTFVNDTQLTATVPATDLVTAGTFQISVQRNSDNKHTPNKAFIVNNVAPTTSSISPNSKNVGDTGFIMTVNGANFASTATVKFDTTSLTPSFVSGAQLTVNIPTADMITAGTHSITVVNPGSGGGTSNAQTFSVVKIIPTITWGNPADITHGTALSSIQLNAGTSVAGNFVYTPPIGTVLNAGNGQTLHVAFTPTDITKYNSASKDVTINVLKITPTITWNNPADITYGTALSGIQLDATASVPGNNFVYSPPSGTVLSAGAGQTLHVVFTPTDITNYNSASKDVTINVNAAPDTIPPVITRLGNDPASVDVGSTYSDAGATALDNVDGVITSNIVTVNPVDTAHVGTYIVRYNVQDAAGNPAVEVTRTVHVVSPPPPPVSELSTFILTATGLIGLLGLVRFSKRK